MPTVNGLEWTFNTEAEKYGKMRPGYPLELYADISNYLHLDEHSNALEVGIGGGQATLPILQTGCSVTAVEYGAALAELCRQKFKDLSSFKVITSKFEDFECADNLYDLIYSASAFHWIPEAPGYAKVYQKLKSGGAFARFANHPHKDKDREELHSEIQKLYSLYMPNSKASDEYSETDAKKRAEIAKAYGFTDISYKLYTRNRTFTSGEYTDLLGTYSDHIAMEEKSRAAFFNRIEKAIDKHGGKITIYDTIDLQLARKP